MINKKSHDSDLIFYEIMWYPIPNQKDFFVLNKKLKIDKEYNYTNFSRNKGNETLKKLINITNRYWNLYRSIPFVSEIFLCNSMSFNATNKDSDIDIFIVAKKNSIRRARFFSAIFFKLAWIKRTLTDKKEKFCLSFYVTQDHTNLQNILLKDTLDIYLIYRLAHLVPLYQEIENNNWIFTANPRFSKYLPNHPQKYCINIWNKKFTWNRKIKKILEFIFWWPFWKIAEKIIKQLRMPRLEKQVKKLWNKWKQIVINNNMLKFHDDIREKISTLYTRTQ